jgi:FlaA1/EpsC-like NDP-sugar epimerase
MEGGAPGHLLAGLIVRSEIMSLESRRRRGGALVEAPSLVGSVMEAGHEAFEDEDVLPSEGSFSRRPRAARVTWLRAAWLNFEKRHSSAIKILLHLALLPLAYFLAFCVRFDFSIPPQYWHILLSTLPLALGVRFAAFGIMRVHRGWWRYVSLVDLFTLLKASTVSSIVLVVVLFFTGQLKGFPRSVLFLDWAFSLALVGGARVLVRVLQENTLLLGVDWRRRTPVLIIGAGNAGERLIRELRRDNSTGLAPVGLIDDDPAKVGMSLHGVRVLGTSDDLASIAESIRAKAAIIAMPSASREDLLRIARRCGQARLKCQIVPSLPELLNGTARLSQVREVRIEDLLGRGAVVLDLARAQASITGKVVVVTGGAGSIGSELARQVAALGPRQLILVEQAESPLYFIDIELRASYPDLDLVPIVADICDRGRVVQLFEAYRPHYVLHAAAYKHVPLMEHNVVEAVRNNVFGTLCVAECAAESGAERFVLVSTDKAVRPSSVMGATKRVAERLVLGWPTLIASKTDFRAVRFGNVLGSNGSVIPLFKEQLSRGGPLTVTHPEVTRYFMTITEAAQLVLIASTLPDAAGRISMLEMGEPIKIRDLAENLIRLSGLEPGLDIEIKYTGLRPGEKLYEELMSAVEETVPTDVEKIRVVQTHEPDGTDLKAGMRQLSNALSVAQSQAVLAVMVNLVPECVSPLRERGNAGAKRSEAASASNPGMAAAADWPAYSETAPAAHEVEPAA